MHSGTKNLIRFRTIMIKKNKTPSGAAGGYFLYADVKRKLFCLSQTKSSVDYF